MRELHGALDIRLIYMDSSCQNDEETIFSNRFSNLTTSNVKNNLQKTCLATVLHYHIP